MGDHRAGSSGSTAPQVTAPPASSVSDRPTGRRIARRAEQQRSTPYAGRRVARDAPVPPVLAPTTTIPAPKPTSGTLTEVTPYAGRRVAGRPTVAPVHPSFVEESPRLPGRRMALESTPESGTPHDSEDLVAHLLVPTAPTTLAPYSGRRIAHTVPLIMVTEPVAETDEDVVPVLVIPEVLLDQLPEAVAAPVPTSEPAAVVVPEVVIPEVLLDQLPEVVAAPVPTSEPAAVVVVPEVFIPEVLLERLPEVEPRLEVVPDVVAHLEAGVVPEPGDQPVVAPESAPATMTAELPVTRRQPGRRASARHTRMPSLPLLAGVAVLAISAGGALQAMHPDLAGAAAAGRLTASGQGSGGSAGVLAERGTVVSRSGDRSTGTLRAAADAQAQQRDAALSAFALAAQKKSAQIELHQWVLPVQPGAYHLTARFGDYSALWSNFHTGLDFAGPTGTPIMAVAAGTITETGYSGAYGNRTIEKLPDGTELWYCHQNDFGTTVGAAVKPGQVIGYIGSTGNVTGPHLHLEVHPGGGDPVDPYAALVAHGLYPGPPR